MKALIITYYWPPAGGSGVQRWLYFVNYLREFDVEPVVFTVKNPNYPIEDQSLEHLIPKGIEIIKQSIWEPNSFFGTKQKGIGAGFLQQNPSFIQRIAQYIRANYFIPDARKFWLKPAVKTINQYLKKEKIDWIISTGPPHTTHLIAKKIKQNNTVKWLADFRNPWTEIDYFHQLPLTKKSLKKHLRLEKSVIKSADVISVVSQSMKDSYSKQNKNTVVITNGYDGELSQNEDLDTKFSLTHIGMLNADRNPLIFWDAISELINENIDFKKALQINLIGKIANEVGESIRKKGLETYVNTTNYIPHHDIQKHQAKSQVLLLFVNNVPSAKGIVTGKIFEYLRAQRPILAIAPTNGDLAGIIRQTNSGHVFDFKDKTNLKKELLLYFELYKKKLLSTDSQNITQFHRKQLTKQLAKVLKNG
jgi:glycosyltransferase involved in cell wall biosynthesis